MNLNWNDACVPTAPVKVKGMRLTPPLNFYICFFEELNGLSGLARVATRSQTSGALAKINMGKKRHPADLQLVPYEALTNVS